MADDFDYSLLGDSLIKPSTGESADPKKVLQDKVVGCYENVLVPGVDSLNHSSVGMLFFFTDTLILWWALV